MKQILIALLFLSNSTFSQDSPSSFWQNKCDFITDGTGKSLGLKIKLSVPCKWEQANGDRPHVVKKFSYSSGTNSAIFAITINKMPGVLSKSEIEEMFSQEGLKEMCKDYGTFISGRKLKIDGQDCGEMIFKMTRETTVETFHMYFLYYFIIYKDKMIVLSYTTGSTTDKKAKEMFEEYKTLFKGLAGNTVLLSKWE